MIRKGLVVAVAPSINAVGDPIPDLDCEGELA